MTIKGDTLFRKLKFFKSHDSNEPVIIRITRANPITSDEGDFLFVDEQESNVEVRCSLKYHKILTKSSFPFTFRSYWNHLLFINNSWPTSTAAKTVLRVKENQRRRTSRKVLKTRNQKTRYPKMYLSPLPNFLKFLTFDIVSYVKLNSWFTLLQLGYSEINYFKIVKEIFQLSCDS